MYYGSRPNKIVVGGVQLTIRYPANNNFAEYHSMSKAAIDLSIALRAGSSSAQPRLWVDAGAEYVHPTRQAKVELLGKLTG